MTTRAPLLVLAGALLTLHLTARCVPAQTPPPVDGVAGGAMHIDTPADRVGHVLDDWHGAASDADFARYFGHMTDDCVFLGTDETERWTIEQFKAFARPYFDKGEAWTFLPVERHVTVADDGRIAWFDERLASEHLGACRGSGVLRRVGANWRIAQYNLTIPVPNPLAYALVEDIRAFRDKVPVALGDWRAHLDVPGGELPFKLSFSYDDETLRAFVTNGPETIEIPVVEAGDGRVRLEFDHYDSRIEARIGSDGRSLDGTWTKQRRASEPSSVPFGAEFGYDHRFKPVPALLSEPPVRPGAGEGRRWSVRFASEEDEAVGVFEDAGNGRLHATFLTTTGDYRYIEGDFANPIVRLSVFDGAHAFLFVARLQADGSLRGDFWSGSWWHDTFTATADPDASLPDAWTQTKWLPRTRLSSLAFPDSSGRVRSLADPAFKGRARIIELFGTWCPNCADATRELVALHEQYADRGLHILALAFEVTGDFRRDASQVDLYVERFGIPYPVLIAGVSDKATASTLFPLVDRVRSYPTILFLDADNRVRAVHTGFSGPATGPAWERQQQRFRRIIEDLLGE